MSVNCTRQAACRSAVGHGAAIVMRLPVNALADRWEPLTVSGGHVLRVITGPPCSGKTTYVKTHARTGDLVIDYDVLANALTHEPADTHRHPEHVLQVTRRVRAAAISEALKLADDTDVWLIHTDPTPNSLARYARHEAEIIAVDPGRDVVLARCAALRPRGHLVAAERWYASQSDAQPVSATRSRDW